MTIKRLMSFDDQVQQCSATAWPWRALTRGGAANATAKPWQIKT